MGDYPIIFSAPMVLALLAGRKTMTRRLAWREPRDLSTGRIADSYGRPTPWQKVKAGDRLYVRENFYITDNGDFEWAVPAADTEAVRKHLDEMAEFGKRYPEAAARLSKLRPCIHMPRVFSRLTLAVTAAKIEPLQDISEDDARAEGIDKQFRQSIRVGDKGHTYNIPNSYRGGFCNIWCDLHGSDSWPTNPDVVALTFTVHKANIDSMTPSPAV